MSVGRWDDVVVGAGSAGCCVARRLADAGRRVVLVEAGPGLPAPVAIASPNFLDALDEPGWTWPHLRVTRQRGGEAVPYLCGRGVGGSSAVNGLVAMAGDVEDYQRWEHRYGCVGRGWPWFRQGLRRAVERLRFERSAPGPFTAAMSDAARAAGHSDGGTTGEPGRLGFMAAQLTLWQGRRWSAADAYLTEAPQALAVRSGAVVERVVFEGRRACGVELQDASVVEAERVVLAAGALHSPVLLARSGVRLPGLGRNVRDHPAVAFTVALRPGSRATGTAPPVSHVLRWSSAVASGRGDLQLVPMDHLGRHEDGRSLALAMVALMDVRSSGSVLGPTGDFAPRLDLLHDDVDLERLTVGVRHAVDLLGSEAVAGIGAEATMADGTPAAQLREWDAAEIAGWLPGQLGQYAHVGGGCGMGPDGDDQRVVDLDGAVVGREQLFVVDASVFPNLPRANLHLPVLAVAEQLAAGLVHRVGRT